MYTIFIVGGSMKRIRFVSVLLSWACFFCLCSIGFSTWFQFDPVNVEASGNFVGYDPVNMDECIYAESRDFKVFDYSSLSFVKSDANGKTEVDTGTISVVYTVNLKNVKAALGEAWNGGTLNVNVSLSYENIAEYDNNGNFNGLFLLPNDADPTLEKKDIAVKVASGNNPEASGSAPTGAVQNNGTEISFSHTLTGLGTTGTVSFTVIYRFEIPKNYTNGSVGNFSYHFGRYLKTADSTDGKATQFITTARIVELLA